MAITLGLVEAIDSNGVYVSMPGSRGVLRGPYKSLSTVAAGTTVLVASTDDGEQVVVGPAPGGHGYHNVASFGAKGDGITDDSEAVRAAMTAAAGGGTVLLPTGTYLVSRDGTEPCALSVPPGVTIEGPGVVKLADDSDTFVSVFEVETSGVTFRGLTIDGNAANQSVEVNEQRHGILASGATWLRVEDCTIQSCAGDGIQLNGAEDVTISRCRIDGNDRNAVTLYATGSGNATSRVRIVDNELSAEAQAIDSEPDSDATLRDIAVVANRLESTSGDYAIAIAGSDSSTPSQSWTVVGNRMRGSVFVYATDDVVISDNIIEGSADKDAVLAMYRSEGVTLANNVITAQSGNIGVRVARVGSEVPTRWRIAGNTITVAGGCGVEVDSVGSASVVDNHVLGDNTSGWGGVGLSIAVNAHMQDLLVSGNKFMRFSTGIYAANSSSYTLDRLVITGNAIDNDAGSPNADFGVRCVGTTSDFPMLVVADNVVSSVYSVDFTDEALFKHGFFGSAPIAKPTVTGSRGGNAALASLLTQLASLGLITDSST